jgi:predicted metal-dependent phosphoesterase TrpH
MSSTQSASRRFGVTSQHRDAADLHVHTTHSDGVYSPCEVIVAAARAGLTALAITDHDTVSAITVARPETTRWGIELISGVELTSQLDNCEIHILGYFINEHDSNLQRSIVSLRENRERRINMMAGRLRELGFVIDLEAIRRMFPRAALGRRHLAEHLVQTHQVANTREAFARYLGDRCPACLEKPRLEAATAIGLVTGAGGVAALAHPPQTFQQTQIKALMERGLRAIEVNGPGFSEGKSRRLRYWAEQLELVPIAGSDFHSPDRPGRWVGAITTPSVIVDRLRRATSGITLSSDAEEDSSTVQAKNSLP